MKRLGLVFLSLLIVTSCSGSRKQQMQQQMSQFKSSRNKNMLESKTFDAKSPYKEFTGIYKSFRQFRGFTKKMAVGHLVFKNGNEYKGSFFNGNFSGLGQLKTKEGVQSGIFLDGLLVKPLEINLDFDFQKMKAEFQGEALYVQGGLGVDVVHPRYGQVVAGEFKGWMTKTFPKDLSYTTQLPIDKVGSPTFLANNVSPDIRVNISPALEFHGCAEFTFDGARVSSKNPRSEGWNVGRDGVYYLTSHWYDAKGSKKKIPREMLTDWGLLVSGARSHRSFQKIKGQLVTDYPKIRASVLKQAREDKNYECFSEASKSEVKGYLAALEVENKESSEALAMVIKQKKEWEKKNRLSPAEYRQLMRQKSQEALAKQYQQTANCKEPHYHWGELKCNGEKVEGVWMRISNVKKNYLTPTRAGLIPVSGYLRSKHGPDHTIKVFNVHPNLGKTTTYKCEVCGGKGFLMTQQKNVTKFSPTYKYRNGLEIKTTTTHTSYQKRYGGICGRCYGHGMVPAAWAYGK